MEDKVIISTALTYTKNAVELLSHGAVEASTKSIKNAFQDSLDKYLDIQGSIFKEMEAAGLYKMEEVPASKITKASNKHTPTL